MFKLVRKIFTTPKKIIPITAETCKDTNFIEVGEKIHKKVKKLFRGSLAIRQVDAGSDNACEQELVALSNAFYDVERFGIHFVASPKHADMLMVTGPVARNMEEALKRAYNNTPDPKIIVAVGDDAINGGIFKNCYATKDGVSSVIPVHYHIPGDPPSPLTIICHLLKILEAYDNKQSQK
jgi:Ni,Fe-hydrogenase III small subunit